MIQCPKCKELIGTSAPVYKAARGFVDKDGNFYEDESVIVHIDCYYEYTFNPFEVLEQIMKDGKRTVY